MYEENTDENELTATMELVYGTITAATHYGVVTEVMASALLALKRDPSLSIEEALNLGLDEWDV